ncbi:MAG: pyridoxamine kinase [Methanomassiliicoccaceae archaeon]|nr:pyridoxamine kinase [Methanomassiliicoccaceae archaeon]
MNAQKRVAAIHDISCFGRCSLTAALPIISAAGVETSVIPTAVLSTHTGGFDDFTYRDLTEDISKVVDHWISLNLKFSAVYTGFLGSIEQIDIICGTFDRLGSEDTMIIVDPVMADNGILYKTFPQNFPEGMKRLCGKADVIIPNITEATLLLNTEYRDGPYTEEYIEDMLLGLGKTGANKIVLTGVFFNEKEFGAATYDTETENISYSFFSRIPGHYHGTGDVFGSALVASMVNNVSFEKAAAVAAGFTAESIKRTYAAGTDTRFGVNFEEGLKDLPGLIAEARS